MSGAAFRPAAIFGNRMVLGRDRPICLFGEAEEGARVSARLGDRVADTNASAGQFLLTLPPMAAGGPYTLTLRCGSVEYSFSDVLIGEVYLAGGQSNMEMELRDARDGAHLCETADEPQVRYYNVPKIPWLDEAALAAEREARWKPVAPGKCGDMSAVAFHFALALHAKLGVPVGIIDCYWGGTSIACWMDEPALRLTAAGTTLWDAYAKRIAGKSDAAYAAEARAHDEAFSAWCARLEQIRAEAPEAGWDVWHERAGACPWNPPAGRKSPFRPAGLMETMLRRTVPYTLTGFLYYQGEEDTSHPELYLPLMMTLVPFWRSLFRDDALPFLFVQLPMYAATGEEDDGHWPMLRDAQARAARLLSRTGLAVLIDGGEFDNIHPADKRTVGERLCLQALRVAFGLPVEANGPRALSAWPQGSEMRVTLSAPVCAAEDLTLLELASADGVFYPANGVAEGATLRLHAATVPEPVRVRYAWVNYAKVHLFGENGLPLAPFSLG